MELSSTRRMMQYFLTFRDSPIIPLRPSPHLCHPLSRSDPLLSPLAQPGVLGLEQLAFFALKLEPPSHRRRRRLILCKELGACLPGWDLV